jgi:mannose-6-phosphate isomerase-like protein (cupin superfamily)
MTPATRATIVGLLAVLAAPVAVGSRGQTPAAGATHVTVRPSEVKWRPLRPGAEIAVVSGDPDKAGAPFVMRMRYQGVVRVPPHWHPTDEHITVLSGTFMVGMGEREDKSSAMELAAGGYAFVPQKMPHYAWSKGDTVVQVHGIGPFAINYVNPADDPNKGVGKK